jgi:hypothetical protein
MIESAIEYFVCYLGADGVFDGIWTVKSDF